MWIIYILETILKNESLGVNFRFAFGSLGVSGIWVNCGHTQVNYRHMDFAGVLAEFSGTQGRGNLFWDLSCLPIFGCFEAAAFFSVYMQFGF